ncbi:hypothetical protein BDY21DRAFT_357628 [Lineolata rhizophorae]|uniref:Uncharacterized protein n=1 Tax=Lineolata rhizophorae TaxID=578093 RepID=A0A6A6NMW7_9PEZI|nr:hypothetical protein BDY21DRAFT_357628 [Lineolata rhizophorae]
MHAEQMPKDTPSSPTHSRQTRNRKTRQTALVSPCKRLTEHPQPWKLGPSPGTPPPRAQNPSCRNYGWTACTRSVMVGCQCRTKRVLLEGLLGDDPREDPRCTYLRIGVGRIGIGRVDGRWRGRGLV